jgi:hypothetical protein
MDDHPAGDDASATEAYVEDLIERSLEPHRDLWPQEVLDEFAEELRAFLYTHPVGSRMLSRVQTDNRVTSEDRPSPGQELPTPVTSRKGQAG